MFQTFQIQIQLINDFSFKKRQEVEARLADGQLVLEFELIPRRKPGVDFSTAAHPDNLSRNQ